MSHLPFTLKGRRGKFVRGYSACVGVNVPLAQPVPLSQSTSAHDCQSRVVSPMLAKQFMGPTLWQMKIPCKKRVLEDNARKPRLSVLNCWSNTQWPIQRNASVRRGCPEGQPDAKQEQVIQGYECQNQKMTFYATEKRRNYPPLKALYFTSLTFLPSRAQRCSASPSPFSYRGVIHPDSASAFLLPPPVSSPADRQQPFHRCLLHHPENVAAGQDLL